MTTTKVKQGEWVAQELWKRGMGGILVQMAEQGQVIELRCEMPYCFCPTGRSRFEARSTPMTDWAPNLDHYPIPESAGGKRTPDNVRLAHVFCNRTKDGWPARIRAMLAKNKSLEQIAEVLNQKKIPRPHGYPIWTARLVRRVFVA